MVQLSWTWLAVKWREARCQRFWPAPYLTRDVREEMASQIYRISWGPLLALALVAQLVVLLTVGLQEPTRFIPGVVWVAFLIGARVVQRRRGALDGFSVVIAGLYFVTTVAVLTHSVHAPAYWSNILALAIVVPLYGTRAGILLTLWCALTGAAWFWFKRFGWTTGVVHPPSLFAYVFLIGCLACGIGFMSIPTRLLAAALQASEGRRREVEAARRAEQNADLAFRAVFEQTGALTALVKPDGTVLRLNLTGERLLGVAAADYVGQSMVDLPWARIETKQQIVDALLQATQGPERLEAEIHGPHGLRYLQLALAPLRRLDGTLDALVVEGLDVTRLLEVERQLAHSNRLEALGQLAGGVAHDFNNMLLAVQGGIESLRSRNSDAEERAEAVDTMEQATQRASELTRKLLAFGRRDRFETQVLDVSQLIAEATNLLRRTLGAPIELNFDCTSSASFVEGDASSIVHALVNLLVNARDAMPRGGRVTLRTQVIVTDQAWCEAQEFPCRPGTFVELCVEDDGMGMSEEVLARAFDPFFTTKPIGAGTGLGLAAVHGTMLSHGGGVTVESQVGKGSCFRLYFPQATARLSPRVPPSGVGFSPQLNGCVLVVDDEPLVLRVAKRYLNALGATSVIVTDGYAAISALESEQVFDCVLTDIVMPRMSGATLVERIRVIRPELPIVVMSGFPAGATGTLQEALVDCPWLRKPFGATELAMVLGPLLRRRDESYPIVPAS